jgi:hypothetical protein
MKNGISNHIRSNIIGYVALFVALSASAYALPGTNTVDSGDIVNGQVKATDIGTGQVGPTDLAAGSVNSAKVATNSLTGADLANGRVQAADLAGGSVTSAKVADDSLTGADVAESSFAQVPSAQSADTATSATSANTAADANTLDGLNSTDFLGANAQAGGDVGGPLSNLQIAGNAVGSSEVADGSIGSGDIANTTRAISIPLTSFIDCQTDAGALLDFTNGPGDPLPDFFNSTTDGEGFRIRFDADVGFADQNSEICSQVVVPPDYVSGLTPGSGAELLIRVRKSANTAPAERLSCAASVNGGTLGATANAPTIINTGSSFEECDLPNTLLPNQSLALNISATTSSGTMNEEVDILAVELLYTASG